MIRATTAHGASAPEPVTRARLLATPLAAVAKKQKQLFGLGPLSETGIADRGYTPQIWKRISFQKPSGVRTKFFLFFWLQRPSAELCLQGAACFGHRY
jgi:hypothetical protein